MNKDYLKKLLKKETLKNNLKYLVNKKADQLIDISLIDPNKAIKNIRKATVLITLFLLAELYILNMLI